MGPLQMGGVAIRLEYLIHGILEKGREHTIERGKEKEERELLGLDKVFRSNIGGGIFDEV